MNDLFCLTRKTVVVIKDHTTILELVQLWVVVNESLNINTFGWRVHLVQRIVLLQLGDEIDFTGRVEFLIKFGNPFGEVRFARARGTRNVKDFTLLGIG